MKFTTVALVSCLLACLVAQSVSAEGANLLVSKRLLSYHAVAEKELSVVVQIFNIGSGTAHDVVVDDTAWASDFETKVGLESARWDVIAAGTNVSHTYIRTPKAEGPAFVYPARVTYKDGSDGDEKVVYSSTVGEIYVMSSREDARFNAPHYREWAQFTVIASSSFLVPFVVWAFLRTNYVNGLAIASTKSKRS